MSIAATGRTLRQLTADDLDDLGEEIAACPLITDTARTDGQRVATLRF